jgi:hypothetical protein
MPDGVKAFAVGDRTLPADAAASVKGSARPLLDGRVSVCETGRRDIWNARGRVKTYCAP